MTAPATTLQSRFFPAREPSRHLVVVLHGLGDSLEGFLWMPPVFDLPRVNYLLVNAPERYTIGFQWYDIMDPGPGVARSRAALTGLFSELESQGWPAGEIVLFGFSQGCLMSIDFATRHGAPLAGIIGVSGYTYDLEAIAREMHPQARQQAWLITHGTSDDLLPLSRTQAQVEQLSSLGLNIAWHVFHKGHTMDPEEEIPLIRDWIEARWQK